jgi:hypothetical protein
MVDRKVAAEKKCYNEEDKENHSGNVPDIIIGIKDDKENRSRMAPADPPLNMNVRMLKADASPTKRKLTEACGSHSKGYDVWLHVYDLGHITKWLLNNWSPRETQLGAFHCGVEVLGVEWSFQAMVDCEAEDMTGVMCHTPKQHPRHVYRESVWLGSSPLGANEICNVLAKLEKSWPARSYHFLNHNCTDFAEALSNSLAVQPFPTWTHGIAKGLLKGVAATEPSDRPWWFFGMNPGSCASCAERKAACCSSVGFNRCDELCLPPQLPSSYPNA